MIITFSGMDCSGKSTQIDSVARWARQRGHRVRTLWHRGGYSNEIEMLRRAARRLRPSALPTTAEPVAREQAFSKRHIRAAWIGVAWLDTLWAYAVKVRAWHQQGLLVLCDRYVWDTQIDLELRFGLDSLDRHPAWKLMTGLCPQPTARVLLVLPMEEILRRFDVKGEQFRERNELRERRFTFYSDLAEEPGFSVVDATRPMEQVTSEIIEACGL